MALTVNLRLAQTLSAARRFAPPPCSPQADAAAVAIETLSSLSRGIYPSLLSEQGLARPLRSAVAGPVRSR